MSHFYVTLPSDSSMVTYPDNTVAHYVTKLARPIHLDGDYEVALTELIYPRSFHPVEDNELFFTFFVRSPTSYQTLAQIVAPGGYYANESEFAEKVGAFVDKILKEDFAERNASFAMKFDTVTRRLSIDFNCEGSVVLFLRKRTAKKLGFQSGYLEPGFHETNSEFDLNAGQRLMYVYSDVVSYGLVGDVETPLLRVCNVSGEYGEMQRVSFTQLNYLPVARKHIDSIEININNEIGRPMPFAYGKSLVILHFRRRYNLP